MTKQRAVWREGLMIGLLLAAAAWLLFGDVLRGHVYYGGDIARIYLPLRTALSAALREGRLPWWTNKVGIGYPLVAAGEAGALYPPNWLTALLWPPEQSLTITILLHYAWAGWGMFRFCRALGRSRWAAWLGAAVWAWGGFTIAHAGHVSILCTVSWLPWMLLCLRRLMDGANRRERRWPLAALALCIAMQFLAGHAQINLLNLIALGAYALFLGWRRGEGRAAFGRLGAVALALLIGILLAAPQLLASRELGALSNRGGGLDATFFTSYSFHPALIVTWLAPFVRGNPYPEGSIELMVYTGLLPLLLASLALWRRVGRERWFWLGLAVVGYLLALGRWNPLYELLRHVPLLNLFRVPARYLLWSHLALAVLAAQGVDVLLAGATAEPGRRRIVPLTLAILGAGVTLWAAQSTTSAELLVARWQWLPLVLLAASLPLLMLGRSLGRGGLGALLLLLTLSDLVAHNRVLALTYSAMQPRDEVAAPLAVTAHLEVGTRVYTKEEIVPALSVMRESLYPNMGLWQGIAGANVYLPLTPAGYQAYLEDLTAERLNRLAVGYYAIPQLLPVDAEAELYDVRNPLAALPTDAWLPLRLGGGAGGGDRIVPQPLGRLARRHALRHIASCAARTARSRYPSAPAWRAPSGPMSAMTCAR